MNIAGLLNTRIRIDEQGTYNSNLFAPPQVATSFIVAAATVDVVESMLLAELRVIAWY